MAKNYICIGDAEYRIEANWNAVSEFLDRQGYKLSQLSKMDELSVKDINVLFYCSAQEGERMDGRKLDISYEELIGQLGPQDILEFVKIFKTQFGATNEDSKKAAGDTKKKRWKSQK